MNQTNYIKCNAVNQSCMQCSGWVDYVVCSVEYRRKKYLVPYGRWKPEPKSQLGSSKKVNTWLNLLVSYTHRWGKIGLTTCPDLLSGKSHSQRSDRGTLSWHQTVRWDRNFLSTCLAQDNRGFKFSWAQKAQRLGYLGLIYGHFFAMCPITWHSKQIGWASAVNFGCGLIRWLLIHRCWITLTQLTHSRG